MISKIKKINKLRMVCFILALVIQTIFFSGCSKEKLSEKKQKDIDFTVMEAADVPQELNKLITEKKTKHFKLSYSDKENTYIAVGYGEQSTGGYSISVDKLYLTDNAVYIDTTLVGPDENELVLKAKTYPYVVVKTEYVDKNIVFVE